MIKKFAVIYVDNRPVFEPESEEGNKEYKLRLDTMSQDKLLKMTSRLNTIGKQTEYYFYFIGVDDSGNTGYINSDALNFSLKCLEKIIGNCGATVVEKDTLEMDNKTHMAIICVQKTGNIIQPEEIRACFLGKSGSGKTSCISHMTHSSKSEPNIKHDIKHDIIGFNNISDKKFDLFNYKTEQSNTRKNIVRKSSRIVSLFDSPGSDMLHALLAYRPHLNVIIISVPDCSNEYNIYDTNIDTYIELSLMLNIDFVLVFNKCDIIDPEDIVMKCFIKDVASLLKQHELQLCCNGCECRDKCKNCVKYFFVSNFAKKDTVSEYNGLLNYFANYVKKSKSDSVCDDAVDFMINEVYTIPDVGNMVSGVLLNGCIKIGDKLYVGPAYDNRTVYHQITVKSIHKKGSDVREIAQSDYATLELDSREIYLDKHMNIFDSVMGKTNTGSMKIYIYKNPHRLIKNTEYVLYVDNLIERVILVDMYEEKDKNYYGIFDLLIHGGIYIRRQRKCVIRSKKWVDRYVYGIIL